MPIQKLQLVKNNRAMPERSVWLVEDDQETREMLHYILVNEGYIVKSMKDGREAVSRYPYPDLVVADLVMPYVDGVETIRTLRERSYKGSAVLITAADETRYAKSLSDSGLTHEEFEKVYCDAVVRIPFELSEILDTLDEAIRRRSA